MTEEMRAERDAALALIDGMIENTEQVIADDGIEADRSVIVPVLDDMIEALEVNLRDDGAEAPAEWHDDLAALKRVRDMAADEVLDPEGRHAALAAYQLTRDDLALIYGEGG